MTENTENPFVGARTFERQESDLFFGREREAFDLLSLVISDRLVLFYAQSGAGKSSLINTRLIPGLLDDGEFQVLPVGRLRRDEAIVESVGNIYIYNLLTSLSKQNVDESVLANISLSDYLRHLHYSERDGYFYDETLDGNILTTGGLEPYKYVIIIDQFEELFTTYEEKWKSREDFFLQLATAMTDFARLRVLLVMREDYIAHLDPYLHLLPGGLRTRYYMQRLNTEQAIEAVEGPAKKRNRFFAEGAAQTLVDALSQVIVRGHDNQWQTRPGQYVEPVQLQVVCSSLWNKLPGNVTIIPKEYVETHVGDLNQALGNFYEQRVKAVASGKRAQEKKVKEREIRRWFERELIIDGKRRNMVAQEPGGKSGGLDDQIVQEFVGSLVREEKRSGGATFYELTHDRMVEPILENNKDWFRENSSLLQQQTALWLQQGRSNALLLRGKALRDARKEAGILELTEDERAFLTASVIAARNLLIVFLTTGIAVMTLVVLFLLAIQARNEAQLQRDRAVAAQAEEARQRQIAETAQAQEDKQRATAEAAQAEEAIQRQLAVEREIEAEAQRSVARAKIYEGIPGELYTSMLLAIDSMEKRNTAEAEDILRKNLSLLPVPVVQFSQAGGVTDLVIAPSGEMFATVSAHGTVCTWRIEEAEGSRPFCTSATGANITAIAFSQDSSFIVTGDQMGRVQIVDPLFGDAPRAFQRVDSLSGWPMIEEVMNNGVADETTSQHVSIRNIHISPQQRITLIFDDGWLLVFDPNMGSSRPVLLRSSGPRVSGISRDGGWLVTGSEAGGVYVWNLGNASRFQTSTHRGGVLALAFSPVDNKIVTAGSDTIAVANLSIAQELYRIPIQSAIRDIAFSPDGNWFVTGSDDERIRVWEILRGAELRSMSQDGAVTDVAVSADGRWIASTGNDRTARVWDAATGAQLFQIPLEAAGAQLAFANNDQWLVTTDASGAVAIWDISVILLPELTLTSSNIVNHVHYSPSGEWLAVASEDKVYLLTPGEQSIIQQAALGSPVLDLQANVSQLLFSHDSTLLGTLTEGNEVDVYNLQTRGHTTIPVTTTIQSIAFTPDNERLYTLGSDGNLQSWDIQKPESPQDAGMSFPEGSLLASAGGVVAASTPEELLIISEDVNGGVPSAESHGTPSVLAMSADGSLLATGTASGDVTIYRFQDHQLVQLSSFQKEQAVSLAFHTESGLLAVGAARNVYLMDVTSGTEVARISHLSPVNSFSFSVDGNYLVTAASRFLRFWATEEIPRFRTNELTLTACLRLPEGIDVSRLISLFPGEDYEPVCERQVRQ